MSQIIQMNPIGVVRSSRRKPEDDHWDREQVHVELEPAFPAETLTGLSDFSHVIVVFHFAGIDPGGIRVALRHPRDNPDWPKVGIFASRASSRPNRIGVTISEILRIEGNKLYLKGLDAVDGSPVLDLKPWVAEFGPRGRVFQPGWMSELMREYWE